MGIFNINPKDFSTITCSLNTDETSDYIVLASSINMNERKRLEVLYAAGEGGGSVRKSRRGLAEITFRMVVFGATSETLLDNYRVLVTAVTAERGGTIQYKPRGLGAGVLDTYYHYLQSSPPRIVRQGHLDPRSLEKLTRVGGEGGELGILCEIKLMTQAWATSEPDTLQTIVAQTTIDNIDDSSTDNCVIVPDSSIKGDCVVPIIEIAPITDSAASFLVHKREMLVGSNTNLDYLEAEDATTAVGWTITDVAGTSGGKVLRATIAANSSRGFTIPLSLSIDSTYLGKIVPMICVRVEGTKTVDFSAALSFGSESWGYPPPPLVDWVSLYGTDEWRLLYSYKEVDLPPFPIPDRLSTTSSPTIGQFVDGRVTIAAYNHPGAGSAVVDVDFIILAKANEWLGEIVHKWSWLDTGRLLTLDTITGCAVLTTTAGLFMGLWDKTGVGYDQLLLHKGYDTRLRFLSLLDSDVYPHANQFNVTIKGIYNTMYPFNET